MWLDVDWCDVVWFDMVWCGIKITYFLYFKGMLRVLTHLLCVKM